MTRVLHSLLLAPRILPSHDANLLRHVLFVVHPPQLLFPHYVCYMMLLHNVNLWCVLHLFTDPSLRCGTRCAPMSAAWIVHLGVTSRPSLLCATRCRRGDRGSRCPVHGHAVMFEFAVTSLGACCTPTGLVGNVLGKLYPPCMFAWTPPVH